MLRGLKIIFLICLDSNTVFKYNLTIKYSIIIMQNVILAIVNSYMFCKNDST